MHRSLVADFLRTKGKRIVRRRGKDALSGNRLPHPELVSISYAFRYRIEDKKYREAIASFRARKAENLAAFAE